MKLFDRYIQPLIDQFIGPLIVKYWWHRNPKFAIESIPNDRTKLRFIVTTKRGSQAYDYPRTDTEWPSKETVQFQWENYGYRFLEYDTTNHQYIGVLYEKQCPSMRNQYRCVKPMGHAKFHRSEDDRIWNQGNGEAE